MLSFVVSEYGVRPEPSNIYPNGYKVLSNSVLKFMPYSSIKVDIGLILKCPSHDFIYIVIDDTYNNLLIVENNIIEDNINTTYSIIIKNMTNNIITIDKDNVLCHFYSKDKIYLHITKVEDSKMRYQSYDNIIQNCNVVINNNITNTTPIEEIVQEVTKEEATNIVEEAVKVVEEAVEKVAEEVTNEEVAKVVEEVVEKVAEEVVEEVVQKVINEIVEEFIAKEDTAKATEENKLLQSNNLELHIDTSEIDNNITSVKRKYIRKKKTKTSLS